MVWEEGFLEERFELSFAVFFEYLAFDAGPDFSDENFDPAGHSPDFD